MKSREQQLQHSNVAARLPFDNLVRITEEQFERNFSPMPNQYLDKETLINEFHSVLFDPFEKSDMQHVKQVLSTCPRQVWTLMDIDDQDILVSGYHPAKRVGYRRIAHVISQTPINDGVEMYVPINQRVY